MSNSDTNTNILCLIVVLVIVGMIILLVFNLPVGPIDPIIETMTTTTVCPPGWTGSGTDTDPCKNQTASQTVCQTKSFNGVDWNGQRKWAKQCGVKNWPGILCPADWVGIGTGSNPCTKPGNKCSPAIFDTDAYAKDFTKVVAWANNCDVDWSGVICPKGWTGRGIVNNPCIPSDNNKYCRKVAFDTGFTQYSTVDDWLKKCGAGSATATNNPIVMYSAGKWQ